LKIFLSIAGVLAWLFGAMLLVAPAQFYQPTGMVLTPMLATLAQAHGATLVGLGTVIWLARSATGQGLIAVLAGNVVVQVLSLVVVVRTMVLGAGAPVAPGIAIHVILGGLFLYFLMRARKAGPHDAR
jgi:hypothetical protein